MGKIIELKKLSFGYKENVFEDLSLSIDEGSFYIVLGKSKSTLAKILGGLLIDGIGIEKAIILFENPNNQLYTDTVKEEILFSASSGGLSVSEFEKKVVKLNKLIPIFSLLDRSISSLSASEKQFVVLISALFQFPSCLILDESLSMMDSIMKENVYKLLSMYNKKGMTIIHMTNNVEECIYGDSVILLNNKNVVYRGSLKKAMETEKIFTDNGIRPLFITELTSKLKYYNVVKKKHYNIESLAGELWG